jgi:two-component system, OmpR family, KDP operon response regulator KdpE
MIQNKIRVLVVDDEPAIRKFLRVALVSQGYTVDEASNGKDAVSIISNDKPDIIILDLGLPDMDGIEVIRLVRQWIQTPIIVLSVRNSEKDKVDALDAGADDYLIKPFSVGELSARLRAALRHLTQSPGENTFSNRNLSVDLLRRVVISNGKEVQLTPNEYDILRVLISHGGKVLTHLQLLREVWGKVYEQEFHILHVNISNLRRKIEPDPTRPQYIITEPGVGYRLRIE